MKSVFLVVMMVIVMLGIAGCALETSEEIHELEQSELVKISESNHLISGEILISDKQRIISSGVTKTELKILVDGNSAFTFDLYRILKETDGNLFYSSYSISLALAMTYLGACGETEKQMADTLHFILSQDRLHPTFNSLDIELSKRGEGVQGKDGDGFRLHIVNAIWGQKGYQFLSTFLDSLAENYGAGLRILNFEKEPEESRITINNWVSDQTEGRIPDLIPRGLISALTRLVLTNAIYFNAAWQYPFDENRTYHGSFYLLNGDEVTVPMVKQTESFGYAESDGYQAIELPYSGGEISMVILFPTTVKFKDFENTLDIQKVEGILNELEHKQITLSMPKFEFESSFSVKDALILLGMPVAFSGGADFSGMTGNRNLFISDVIHKAFVSIDEAGTEAAAATAVVMRGSSVPHDSKEVTINSPFIFFIRDIQTGTILFAGRVMDPSG